MYRHEVDFNCCVNKALFPELLTYVYIVSHETTNENYSVDGYALPYICASSAYMSTGCPI